MSIVNLEIVQLYDRQDGCPQVGKRLTLALSRVVNKIPSCTRTGSQVFDQVGPDKLFCKKKKELCVATCRTDGLNISPLGRPGLFVGCSDAFVVATPWWTVTETKSSRRSVFFYCI